MPPAEYYESAGDYDQFHERGSDVIRWWHKSFFQNFPRLHLKGKILDVGCADGRFLLKMKTLGWDIYGLDLDRVSVNVARVNCATQNIFHGLLGDIDQFVEPHSFDVITFFEVLEHQSNPIAFISAVKKLLKPGGMIAGSVPNRDRYIVSVRFAPDHPPHHFTMWNYKVLKNFLNKYDFTDVTHRFTRYKPILFEQIVRQLAEARISKIKAGLGVRSLQTLKNNTAVEKKALILAAIKRYFWNPTLFIFSITEYPILWFSHKSVSMYFDAELTASSKKTS